jgi:hypothetical protein
MNRVVKWGLLAFAAWWVIKDPTAAGQFIHKAGALASQAASSLATLVSSI